MFRLVTRRTPDRLPPHKPFPIKPLRRLPMGALKSREIRLKSRPEGMPGPANFELAEVTLPDPGPGQILVRNSYMTVAPYMRGRMTDRRSYVPGFQIGEAMTGGAVGQVVAAGPGAHFKVGDQVQSMAGWRGGVVGGGPEVVGGK